MRSRFNFISVTALFVFTTMWASAASAREIESADDQEQVHSIHSVTYQYLIEEHGWTGAEFICLGVGGWGREDPEPAPGTVVQGFGEHVPPVVSSAECEVDAEQSVHMNSGAPAQVFQVSPDISVEGSRAVIHARYHVHGLHAAEYRCELRKVGSSWEVRECRVQWQT